MEHVGWVRRHIALYYLQLAKVLNPDGSSARFSTSSAAMVVAPWQDANQLKRFVCAFPSSEQKNAQRSDCIKRWPKQCISYKGMYYHHVFKNALIVFWTFVNKFI